MPESNPELLVNQLEEGHISRREFVRRASALGLSVPAIAALLAWGEDAFAADVAASGNVKVYKGPFAANEADLQKQMVALFNKKFPNIQVKVEQFDWPTMEQQTTASLAAASHDINYMPEHIYAKFAQKSGPLADLSPLISQKNWQKERNRIGNNYWSSLKPRGAALSAVPYVSQPNSMFFVNQSLLKKYGVGNEWQRSWAAFAQAAKKLTRDGNYGVAIRTNGLVNFGWFDWLGYIRRAGGDFLNSTWTKSDLDKPRVAAALDYWKSIHEQSATPTYGQYTWPALRDLFIAGRIAFMHDEATFATNLTAEKPDFTWDVVPFPKPDGKIAINDRYLSIAGVFTIPQKSKNKQAAWEMIKFYSSLQAVRFYLPQVSILSVRTDAANIWKVPALRKVQVQFQPKSRGPQLHPKLNEFVNIVQPLVDSVYAGKTTGAKAMKDAATQINKRI
jgi:ABC-type glycerol-3-phosphate transport system substrate-binding protein